MYEKLLAGIVAFGLLSVAALGIVSASPAKQVSGEQDSFQFLIVVLSDLNDRNLLTDTLSDLLSDWFIENMIAPDSGEMPGEVRERLAIQTPEEERSTLVTLYNATDGSNWKDSENWLSDMPVSEWYGVTTDIADRITNWI